VITDKNPATDTLAGIRVRALQALKPPQRLSLGDWMEAICGCPKASLPFLVA